MKRARSLNALRSHLRQPWQLRVIIITKRYGRQRVAALTTHPRTLAPSPPLGPSPPVNPRHSRRSNNMCFSAYFFITHSARRDSAPRFRLSVSPLYTRFFICFFPPLFPSLSFLPGFFLLSVFRIPSFAARVSDTAAKQMDGARRTHKRFPLSRRFLLPPFPGSLFLLASAELYFQLERTLRCIRIIKM